MQASIHLFNDTLVRRQPCVPSCSSSRWLHQRHLPQQQQQSQQHQQLARFRSNSTTHKCLLSSEQAAFTAPSWHPRLFKPAKRQQLEACVQKYYLEAWNDGTVDVLQEVCTPGVCYADVFGSDCCDGFGVSALKGMMQDFQSTHPLLRYTVDEVIVDEDHDTAVAHYTATAANLLASRDGVPATGQVSTIHGMDKFRFDRFGHCTSIESYRQRFADEEELQLMDWDSA